MVDMRNYSLSVAIALVLAGILIAGSSLYAATQNEPPPSDRILHREIDHELNVACYWIEDESDIDCIQLDERGNDDR